MINDSCEENTNKQIKHHIPLTPSYLLGVSDVIQNIQVFYLTINHKQMPCLLIILQNNSFYITNLQGEIQYVYIGIDQYYISVNNDVIENVTIQQGYGRYDCITLFTSSYLQIIKLQSIEQHIIGLQNKEIVNINDIQGHEIKLDHRSQILNIKQKQFDTNADTFFVMINNIQYKQLLSGGVFHVIVESNYFLLMSSKYLITKFTTIHQGNIIDLQLNENVIQKIKSNENNFYPSKQRQNNVISGDLYDLIISKGIDGEIYPYSVYKAQFLIDTMYLSLGNTSFKPQYTFFTIDKVLYLITVTQDCCIINARCDTLTMISSDHHLKLDHYQEIDMKIDGLYLTVQQKIKFPENKSSKSAINLQTSCTENSESTMSRRDLKETIQWCFELPSLTLKSVVKNANID